MDAGNWIALAAAVVGIGGVAVAVGLSASARRRAATAHDQADTARQAADSAQAQAQRQAATVEQQVSDVLRRASAVEQQVQLMRRQLDAAEVERHEREGPDFYCRAEGRTGSVCPIVVTMTSGPGEVSVRVAEQWVVPRTHRALGHIRIEGPVDDQEYRVVPHGSFTVQVDLNGYQDRVVVGLQFECVELDWRHRSWTRHRSVPVDPAPSCTDVPSGPPDHPEDDDH